MISPPATFPRPGHRPACFIAVCLFVVWFAPRLMAADSLVWHRENDRIDADIDSLDLPRFLQQVANSTGWQIYLDPGASHVASARFSNLQTGDALRALLGDLNFALLPQTNGPSQLYVFRTSQQQATRLIQAPPQKKVAQPIPNQLVVTLKPGSRVKIEELARSVGAKIIGRMDAQGAYLLQFDSAAATLAAQQQLANDPNVASVDVNYPVDHPPTVQLAQSSTPDLQLNPKTNSGPCQLVVGLIDTAVQPLSSNLAQFVLPSLQVGTGSQVGSPQPTHGTAMAETILRAIQNKTGGNTSVKIQPVDVYGSSETTSTFNVASGIVQAVNNGANIINLSLGSAGDSQFLHNTIIQVTQQGIPVYAAAGNQPVTTATYPAAYPEVVSVTATDSSGQLAPYANRGSFVDMAAPGDNVIPYSGQSYLVEGTSTSTAFASGMAAGLADSAHACADDANALLQKTLKPVPKQ